MNPTQAENLRILIRHMETKCRRTLDMAQFFYEDDNRCGTPACALGEAATLPELQRAGLVTTSGWVVRHDHLVFGHTQEEDVRLFHTSFKGRQNVTPQEWAIEARKVLAENGYAMDEPKADTWAADKVAALVKPLHEEPVAPTTTRRVYRWPSKLVP